MDGWKEGGRNGWMDDGWEYGCSEGDGYMSGMMSGWLEGRTMDKWNNVSYDIE